MPIAFSANGVHPGGLPERRDVDPNPSVHYRGGGRAEVPDPAFPVRTEYPGCLFDAFCGAARFDVGSFVGFRTGQIGSRPTQRDRCAGRPTWPPIGHAL